LAGGSEAADVVLVDEDVESDDPVLSELAAEESEASALESDADPLSAGAELASGAGAGLVAGTAATRVGATAVRWTTIRCRSAATTADGTGGCPTAALMISAVARAEVVATVMNCDQLRRIARSREIMPR
jgi:hypothetical protein